jgi:branched-chain amino acid transport system substrate-binding protein
MKRSLTAIAFALVSLVCLAGAAHAQVKVGILGPFSGPYADWGKEYQRAIDLYLERNNGKNGNPTVTVITRDTGGLNPARAKQLAQELIVRDQVAILGGEMFSPNVLALTDLLTEAKMPFVIFNGATGFITDRSKYFLRPTFTMWHYVQPFGKWAAEQGIKKGAILVADFAAGEDANEAFTNGFESGGGKISSVIKIPMNTTDFSSYLQRLRDAAPEAVFMFVPQGPLSIGLMKAFYDRGLDKAGIKLLGGTETAEQDLPAIGDIALGAVTSMTYGPYLNNPANKEFVAAYKAKYGKDELPGFNTVGAYDGMEVIFRALKAAAGGRDGDKMMAGVAGYSWNSPRGPVSMDPKTREMVQNLYIRRVEKRDGLLGNFEFHTIPNVKDPWHEMNIGARQAPAGPR